MLYMHTDAYLLETEFVAAAIGSECRGLLKGAD